MASSNAKAAAAIGAVALLGGAAFYFLNKQSPTNSQIASIELSASSTNVYVGQSDTLTAVATDSAGNPVSGAKIGFYGDGQFLAYANTDSTGIATFNTSFASPGTYQLYAEG